MEEGKSNKDMLDRELHTYWKEFEGMYQQFNNSFPDQMCANESALRNLHENMKRKVDQVPI